MKFWLELETKEVEDQSRSLKLEIFDQEVRTKI